MANLTGQNAVQALENSSGIRQTASPAPSGSPTALVRADGTASGTPLLNGVPNYSTFANALSNGALSNYAIIEHQCVTPGAFTTFTGAPWINLVNQNFTAATAPTIRFRVGDNFRLTGSGVTINIQNSSYIYIDMSQAGVKIGDSDLNWNYNNVGSSSNPASNPSCLPTTSQQQGYYIQGSQAIRMYGFPGYSTNNVIYGGRSYNANQVYGDCQGIYLKNLDHYLQGNPTVGSAGVNVQVGDLGAIDGTYVLLEGCRWRVGGHDALLFQAVSSIMSYCWVGNNWLTNPYSWPSNSYFATSNAFNVGEAGSRGAELNQTNRVSGDNGLGSFVGPYGPAFYYNSVFADVAHASANLSYPFFAFSGYNNVMIGCWFFDNAWGGAFVWEYFGDSAQSSYNQVSCQKVAHCLGYNLNGLMDSNVTSSQGGTNVPTDFEQMRFLNNIWSNMNAWGYPGSGFILYQATNLPLNATVGGSYVNEWKGSQYGPDLVAPVTSPSSTWKTITTYGSSSGFTQSSATFDNLSSMPANWTSNDAITGAPNFPGYILCTSVNSGSGSNQITFTGSLGSNPDRSPSGFVLGSGANQVGYGTANALTTVVTGTTSSVIEVKDAGWFTVANIAAGANAATWGSFIPEFQNYYPQVGIGTTITNAAGNIVTISSVQWTPGSLTGTITLTTSITVTAGMGVWWAGFAAGPSASTGLWENYGANPTIAPSPTVAI
jgi:hypothetical protein